MKQKLFLGALLLGALTLNSCVDDTESASVTAVRQAKAEQLKSLADLNKANAEAALITANATKAAQEAQAEYLKAQAQYYQAQAAYQQAMAEYQNAENEKQKELAAIQIEQQKILLEQAQLQMENFKKQLEVAAAQLEANLLRAQADIERQKQELQNAINKADKDKQQELQNLLTSYNQASKELFGVQKTLAANEILLAKFQAGIVSAKEAAQELIDEYNQQIAEKEQQIAANEEAIKVLEADYSPTEAAENFAKANLELNTLNTNKKSKGKAKDQASDEKDDAADKLADSPYDNAMVSFLDNYGGDYFSINKIGIYLVEENYAAVVPGANGETVIPVVSSITTEDIELPYKYEGDERTFYTSYKVYTAYYDVVADGFGNYVKAVQASIDATQGKAVTDKKTALDKANADLTKAQNDVKTTKAALDEANKKAEAATKAVKDAVAAGKSETEIDTLKAAETLANAAVITAQSAYDTAVATLGKKKAPAVGDTPEVPVSDGAYLAVEQAEDAYKTAQQNLKDVNEDLAKVEKAWETATAKVSTNAAYVAAVNKANEDYANADVAYMQAEVAANKKQAEVDALKIVYENPNLEVINSQINTMKSENKNLTTSIADLQEKIKSQTEILNDPKFDEQKQIAELQAAIDANKAEIEILQKKVDLYKAQLEKAMESDEPVNPAPAE